MHDVFLCNRYRALDHDVAHEKIRRERELEEELDDDEAREHENDHPQETVRSLFGLERFFDFGKYVESRHYTPANLSRKGCLEILMRNPHMIRFRSIDEPPSEKNGSGIPVEGMRPATTDMLSTACVAMRVVIPNAR
jgi:hypothetical protein